MGNTAWLLTNAVHRHFEDCFSKALVGWIVQNQSEKSCNIPLAAVRNEFCVCWEGDCGTMQLFKRLLGMTLTQPAVASIQSVAGDESRDDCARQRWRWNMGM